MDPKLYAQLWHVLALVAVVTLATLHDITGTQAWAAVALLFGIALPQPGSA